MVVIVDNYWVTYMRKLTQVTSPDVLNVVEGGSKREGNFTRIMLLGRVLCLAPPES